MSASQPPRSAYAFDPSSVTQTCRKDTKKDAEGAVDLCGIAADPGQSAVFGVPRTLGKEGVSLLARGLKGTLANGDALELVGLLGTSNTEYLRLPPARYEFVLERIEVPDPSRPAVEVPLGRMTWDARAGHEYVLEVLTHEIEGTRQIQWDNSTRSLVGLTPILVDVTSPGTPVMWLLGTPGVGTVSVTVSPDGKTGSMATPDVAASSSLPSESRGLAILADAALFAGDTGAQLSDLVKSKPAGMTLKAAVPQPQPRLEAIVAKYGKPDNSATEAASAVHYYGGIGFAVATPGAPAPPASDKLIGWIVYR